MIELKRNVPIYDIVANYPDVKDIMLELGFEDIIKPGMINTVGKFMTLEKGAKLKRIEWNVIKQVFENHGYMID